MSTAPAAETIGPPMAMLAELTHRCPLACPYCSNPQALTPRAGELDTAAWRNVFQEAAALGVLQVHLSGGEPVSRRDLVALTAAASGAGLYTNLITSGIGLTEARLAELGAAGLDHVQVSVQGVEAAGADAIAGYRGAFKQKQKVLEWITAAGLPLTLNAVMHKRNLADLGRTIDFAVAAGARRLEVATVQFHGWATLNRAALMPTKAQAEAAAAEVAAARARLAGRLVIDYVPADYHAEFPKACMGGWGRVGLNVTPDGRVLPCHAAETIPGFRFTRVGERPLAEIWADDAVFNAFRGTAWMREPCRSCARKTIDFGGCRCQALALAGAAEATDPVCARSPHHAALAAAAAEGAAVDAPIVARGRAG